MKLKFPKKHNFKRSNSQKRRILSFLTWKPAWQEWTLLSLILAWKCIDLFFLSHCVSLRSTVAVFPFPLNFSASILDSHSWMECFSLVLFQCFAHCPFPYAIGPLPKFFSKPRPRMTQGKEFFKPFWDAWA